MAEAFQDLNAQAGNSTETIDPRKWLSPGWYWADLRERDLPAWNQFKAGNSSVRQTKSTSKGDFTWVLFQVAGSYPVIYTPPGLAYPAFKGEKTEVHDVFESDADYQERAGLGGGPIDDFMAFWPKLMGQIGTAGQVVLWGGVAIVLWQVFQKTGGMGSRLGAGGSKKEEDYEEREEHHVTISRPRSKRAGTGTLASRYR